MANKTRDDFGSNIEYYKYRNSFEYQDEVVLDEEHEEGLALLKQFGFEVLLTKNTFSTWFNDVRQSGFTSHRPLNVNYVTAYIIKFFTNVGFEKGKESKANEMKRVLGL